MLVTYKDKKDTKEMLKSFQVDENIVTVLILIIQSAKTKVTKIKD